MSGRWKQSLMTIPSVGISLLPKLACPLCWPAYTGLLSSVGLGFLISARYLLPLTAAFLVIAVGALAFRVNRRHGYGPFAFGLLASVGVLVGKFWWESNPAMYAAVAVLVIASVWNAWPHRVVVTDCCAEKSIN
jgi:mercuric ion transport protein